VDLDSAIIAEMSWTALSKLLLVFTFTSNVSAWPRSTPIGTNASSYIPTASELTNIFTALTPEEVADVYLLLAQQNVTLLAHALQTSVDVALTQMQRRRPSEQEPARALDAKQDRGS
jgi:hypothetical protein